MGFSGAEIMGFFWEPTRLLTKPEKPDFLRTVGGLEGMPPDSSEYLLGVAACASTRVPDLSTRVTPESIAATLLEDRRECLGFFVLTARKMGAAARATAVVEDDFCGWAGMDERGVLTAVVAAVWLMLGVELADEGAATVEGL